MQLIDSLGAPEDYKIVWRVTPGHVYAQMQRSARAVQAAQIGITITPTNMLIPRKAVTAVGHGIMCEAAAAAPRAAQLPHNCR